MNAQQIDTPDRLPRLDPDPARRLRGRTRTIHLNCPTGHVPNETSRPDHTAAQTRPSTSGEADSYGEALFNLYLDGGAYSLRTLPHVGLELRRPRRQRPGCAWVRTSPAGATNAHFPSETDRSPSSPEGTERRQEVRPAEVRAAVACPAFGNMLTDEADPSHRRIRAEPLVMHALLALNWEPQLRGIIIIIIAVSRAVRLGLPHPRHQPRRPPRLLLVARRPVRLDDADGFHLVVFGIGLKGATPTVEGGERPDDPARLQRRCSRQAVIRTRQLPSEGDDPVGSCCGARSPALHRQRLAKARPESRRASARSASAAGVVRRGGRHATRPATSRWSRCSTKAASVTRRSTSRSTSSPSGTGRATSSSRWRRSSPHVQRAWSGAGHQPRSTRPSRMYVYMVRDLGNKRVPAGGRSRFGSRDRVLHAVLPAAQS